MKFLLYSLNFAPEPTGVGKYNGELVNFLQSEGWDCSAIVAPPYYPAWSVSEGYHGFRFATEIINGAKVIRCPLYVPSEPTFARRLLHLITYAVSSGLALFSRWRDRPDIIFLVQPTLFCAPLALLFCKLTKAKAVMHVQDLEVDALLGLDMLRYGVLSRLAMNLERWLITRFDLVSTISPSMKKALRNKGVLEERLVLFPNWSDTDFVTPHTSGAALRAKWGVADSEKLLLYSGNVGVKQGLEIVLDAAEAMQAQRDVKFVIVGEGAHSAELMAEAAARNLANVTFKPLLPWTEVPAMLAAADIHLVIQKRGVADAVLPSKLTNIFSAGGHAVVTADVDSELGRLYESNPDMFLLVSPECSNSLIDGLQTLLSSDLSSFNEAARGYAERFISVQSVILRYMYDLRSKLDIDPR